MRDMTYSEVYLRGFTAGKQIAEKTYREAAQKKVSEGIAAARERGVRFGRPPKPRPKAFEQLKAAWLDGNISSKKAAEMVGIAQDTFLRWVRDTSPRKMTVDEALEILHEFSSRLDDTNDGNAKEAIEIVSQYISDQRQKRVRRMKRIAEKKLKEETEKEIDDITELFCAVPADRTWASVSGMRRADGDREAVS